MRALSERRRRYRADHRGYRADYRGDRPVSRAGGETGRGNGDAAADARLTRRAAILAGVAAVSVLTDYPDYSPHVAHADQIAATGVPLLTKSTTVANTAWTVAGGQKIQVNTYNIAQIGYEVILSGYQQAAGTSGFVEIAFQWFDSTSNFLVGSDSWICAVGPNSSSAWLTVGHGPTKADQVEVTVKNLDPAAGATGQLTLLQNSRVYARDDWHWVNSFNAGNSVPGFTVATLPDDESVLGIVTALAIPAGATSTLLFGMHNGLVAVGLDMNSGLLSSLAVRIAAEPASVYGANYPIVSYASPPPVFQVAGTRSPLAVALANNATTSITVTMSLTAIP